MLYRTTSPFFHVFLRRGFLLFLLVWPQTLQGQFVFPDLLPPETIGVMSVEDTRSVWASFARLAEIKSRGGNQDVVKGITTQLGYPLDGASLFGKMLLASDLAVTLPSLRGDGSATPGQVSSLEEEREPGLLWVARVGDMVGWQKAVGEMEAFLLANSATPTRPITRTMEQIGDSQIILLCDVNLTLGHLMNKKQRVWALSSDPVTLRYVARRLNLRTGDRSAQVLVPSPLKRAYAAWTKQFAMREGDAKSIRYMFSAPDSLSATRGDSVMASLFDLFRPSRDTAGVISMESEVVRLESFAMYMPGADTALDQAFASLSASSAMPARRFAAPGALLMGGANLFDPALLRRGLSAFIENVDAGLPQSKEPLLAPASFQARARLAALYAQVNDPELIAELGPELFYVLNHFRFGAIGEFPDIDFQVGVRSRDVIKTRLRMRKLEQGLIDAMLNSSSKSSFVPEFRTIVIALPGGGSVSARVLEAPDLPLAFKPCWAVHNGYLLLNLSPEALGRAVRRSGIPQDSDSVKILAMMGMVDAHSYHIAAPSAALVSLEPLLIVAARQLSPALGGSVAAIIEDLKSAEAAVLFSKGEKTGIRTVARIDFKQKAERKPTP